MIRGPFKVGVLAAWLDQCVRESVFRVYERVPACVSLCVGLMSRHLTSDIEFMLGL